MTPSAERSRITINPANCVLGLSMALKAKAATDHPTRGAKAQPFCDFAEFRAKVRGGGSFMDCAKTPLYYPYFGKSPKSITPKSTPTSAPKESSKNEWNLAS